MSNIIPIPGRRNTDDETQHRNGSVSIAETSYMLERMIARQEADFKKFGGVRERLHAARTAARAEDFDKGLGLARA